MLRNKIFIFFGFLLCVVCASSFNSISASALGWQGGGKGYFTGETLNTDGYEIAIRNCSSNNTDGTYHTFTNSRYKGLSSDTMKSHLIYDLKNYYNLGSGCGIKVCPPGGTCSSAAYNKARNAVGARFIMTLLTGGDKTVTGQELIDRFTTMLNDPKLTLSFGSHTYNMNSAHQTTSSGKHDDQFEDANQGTFDSIIFKYNGIFVYAIKALCGNMVGGSAVPSYWEIEPTVNIDKATSTVNQAVTWNVVRADVMFGPTSPQAAAAVTYTVTSKGSGNVGTGSIAKNSAQGVSVSNSPITYSFSTPGNYCLTVTITHGKGWRSGNSVISDDTVTSTPVCVSVGGAVIDFCRGSLGVASPTLYPIRPRTYPYLSNSRVYVNSYGPVPLNVTSSGVGYTWGPYTSPVTLLPDNFTSLNTTGDTHTITEQDTTNHATSVGTNYDTVYYGYYANVYPTYDPLLDVPTPRPPVATWFSYGPVTMSSGSPSSPDPNFLYWTTYPVYRDSTVYYSDGDTRTLVSGAAPQYTTNTGSSTYDSVGPCYDYNLKTAITDPGEFKEEGNPASVTGTVYNNESYTSLFDTSYYGRYQTHSQSKNIKYFVTKITLAPGATRPTTLNNGGRSTSAPCAFYGYSSAVCKIVSQSTMVVPIGSKSVTYDYVVEAVNPGTVICFAFSAFTHSSDPSYSSANLDSGDYYHSPFSYSTNCVLVVKKPKVQIIAGDISVGKSSVNNTTPTGNVNTSTSSKYGSNYGSWVEYAIYAKGSVSGLASGSALAGGRPSGDCQVNLLTYSNTNSTCSGAAGAYTFKSSIKDYGSLYTSGSALTVSPGTNNVNSLNGIYYRQAASTINISSNGSTVNNKVIISAPSSTVVIKNDIVTNFNNSNKLSQVIIIAKNIKIDQSVSRVDAWLLASGDIDTCTVNGVRPTQLTTGVCNSQLEINGPVVANKLYLLRTAGSDPGDLDGTPAETFNLRPDAYLWMYSDSGQKRWKSTYETELPPRL